MLKTLTSLKAAVALASMFLVSSIHADKPQIIEFSQTWPGFWVPCANESVYLEMSGQVLIQQQYVWGLEDNARVIFVRLHGSGIGNSTGRVYNVLSHWRTADPGGLGTMEKTELIVAGGNVVWISESILSLRGENDVYLDIENIVECKVLR